MTMRGGWQREAISGLAGRSTHPAGATAQLAAPGSLLTGGRLPPPLAGAPYGGHRALISSPTLAMGDPRSA